MEAKVGGKPLNEILIEIFSKKNLSATYRVWKNRYLKGKLPLGHQVEILEENGYEVLMEVKTK